MKSQQKLIFFAIIITLISIIILMYFSNNWSEKQQASIPLKEFRLLEVKSDPVLFKDSVYGQVISNHKMEVQMKVSGKIDSDNHILTPGTTFKKNDLLIKVDRLAILYELLIARTDYKQLVNKAIQKLPTQIINQKGKWEQFKNQIHKTRSLPSLPKTNGEREEDYISQMGIYKQYYEVKKLALSAEDYIYAAPFDGVIIKSTIRPGAEVKKNRPLMTISKQGSYIVKAHVPISLVQYYKKTKKMKFLNSEMDTVGHGVFLKASVPSIDSSMVAVSFSIAPQSLKSLGEVVRVVPQKKHNYKGIGIPLTAVKKDSVLIYTSNTLIAVPVQVISTQNDSVFVSGLPQHCFVVLPKK